MLQFKKEFQAKSNWLQIAKITHYENMLLYVLFGYYCVFLSDVIFGVRLTSPLYHNTLDNVLPMFIYPESLIFFRPL